MDTGTGKNGYSLLSLLKIWGNDGVLVMMGGFNVLRGGSTMMAFREIGICRVRVLCSLLLLVGRVAASTRMLQDPAARREILPIGWIWISRGWRDGVLAWRGPRTKVFARGWMSRRTCWDVLMWRPLDSVKVSEDETGSQREDLTRRPSIPIVCSRMDFLKGWVKREEI